MDISFQLEQLTILEKLQAIGEIWKNLAESSSSVPTPSWHNDVLLVRAGRAEDGFNFHDSQESGLCDYFLDSLF